jgi:hypothetical protein
VSTQPQVDRWWWCAACVVNDRLRGCADKAQDGIKSEGCASHKMFWNKEEDIRKEEGHIE